MKKIITLLIILFAVALVGFFYITRPAAEPSADIADVAEPVGGTDSTTQVFRIDATASEASFEIEEILRGEYKLVIGTTNQVGGEIALNRDAVSQSVVGEIHVNARTLKTDSENRNGAIANLILKSSQDAYEFITFTPVSITGLPSSVAVGEKLDFSITGDLTIVDTTRSVTFTATGTLVDDSTLTVEASATVLRSDYGITIPDVPFVASVEDDVTIKLDVVARAVNLEDENTSGI